MPRWPTRCRRPPSGLPGPARGPAPSSTATADATTGGPGGYRSARRRANGRPMSRKGRSPDNSRMEGFFGTVKNEMFYGRRRQPGRTRAEDRWLYRAVQHEEDQALAGLDEPLGIQAKPSPCSLSEVGTEKRYHPLFIIPFFRPSSRSFSGFRQEPAQLPRSTTGAAAHC